MNTEIAIQTPESAVWAFARNCNDSIQLALRLWAARLAVRPGSSIEEIHPASSSLIFIDSVGWGEKCRKLLNQPDLGSHAAPAVLLTGRNPNVIHTAGAAYACVPETKTSQLIGARPLRRDLLPQRADIPRTLGLYQAALRIAPRFIMAHVNRGWILRRMGRRQAFVEEMRAASRILKAVPRAPRGRREA
jgi:hypothetical protein